MLFHACFHLLQLIVLYFLSTIALLHCTSLAALSYKQI